MGRKAKLRKERKLLDSSKKHKPVDTPFTGVSFDEAKYFYPFATESICDDGCTPEMITVTPVIPSTGAKLTMGFMEDSLPLPLFFDDVSDGIANSLVWEACLEYWSIHDFNQIGWRVPTPAFKYPEKMQGFFTSEKAWDAATAFSLQTLIHVNSAFQWEGVFGWCNERYMNKWANVICSICAAMKKVSMVSPETFELTKQPEVLLNVAVQVINQFYPEAELPLPKDKPAEV